MWDREGSNVYIVGRLNGSNDGWPSFGELQDAALAAIAASVQRPTAVIGLWRVVEGDSECLAIAHDGEIYWK